MKKPNTRRFEECSRPYCRQNACLASGDLKLCGEDWRDYQRDLEAKDEKQSMVDQISACDSFEKLRHILYQLVDKIYD